MTKVTYIPTSLYFNTPQVNQVLEYLSFWNGNYPIYSSSDNILLLETKYDKRPDLLSNDLYGSPNWWWIFMIYNPDKIQDPIYDFVPGISIRIPNKSNLPSSIGE